MLEIVCSFLLLLLLEEGEEGGETGAGVGIR